MLTRVNLHFPSNGSLLFERRFSVCQRLNLRLKLFAAIEIMSFTNWAVHIVSGIILRATKRSSLFTNGQFSYLMFLLCMLFSHDHIDEKWMAMVSSMLISIVGTKTIETFHTNIKPAFIFLYYSKFYWLMEASHALVFIYFFALQWFCIVLWIFTMRTLALHKNLPNIITYQSIYNI